MAGQTWHGTFNDAHRYRFRYHARALKTADCSRACAPRMPSSMHLDRTTSRIPKLEFAPVRNGWLASPRIAVANVFRSSRRRRTRLRTTGRARARPARKSKLPSPPRNPSPFQPNPISTPRRREKFQNLPSRCPKNPTSQSPRRFPWTPCRRQWRPSSPPCLEPSVFRWRCLPCARWAWCPPPLVRAWKSPAGQTASRAPISICSPARSLAAANPRRSGSSPRRW